MPVSSSTEHWIRPDALKINLNHFGDPDYLQVSLLAGAVVMAFKQDVISYNAAHNYRTWPLQAANTYLETSSAYHVYARLTRSEVNASALVVYDPVLRDIEGRSITIKESEKDKVQSRAISDEETDEEESPDMPEGSTPSDPSKPNKPEQGDTEILGEPDPNYFYVYLGKISASVDEFGYTTLRTWEAEFRAGSLNTNQFQNEEGLGEWSKMFKWNKVTDLIEVLKIFSSAIFKKFSIKKGDEEKVITDIKRSTDSDDEFLLDDKGEKILDEEGNPIKNPEYVPVSDETIPTTAWVKKNSGEDLFLSKVKDDRSVGKIASDIGFEVGNFEEGTLGQGAAMYADNDKNTYLEADYLKVRKKATFTEITVQELKHVGGEIVLSPAAMVCSKVEDISNGWKCYFNSEDSDGRKVYQEFESGDQARCQTFNLSPKGANDLAGNHYYWRLVTAVGDDYIVLSKTDCDANSDEPRVGDNIAQLGNRTDTKRQAAIILSAFGEDAPSYKQYNGIDGFSLAGKQVTKLSPYGNELTGKLNIEAGSKGAENLADLPDEIFKAVQIGSVNLLLNSGFTGDYKDESLSSGFSLDDSAEMYSKALKSWTGIASVHADSEAVSGRSVEIGSISQEVETIKDEYYVISFKAKGSEVAVSCGGYHYVEVLTSEYKRYEYKFKSNGSGGFLLSGSAKVCDLQLERGTIATDWNQSPYDNDRAFAEFQALNYIKSAIKEGNTSVLGGLILSSMIQLGNYKDGVMQKVNAGMSGIYNDDDDVAFWGGGNFEQAVRTLVKFNQNPNYKPTDAEWKEMANFVVSHGGDVFMRGYIYALGGFFRGKIETSVDGNRIVIDPDSKSLKMYNENNLEVLSLLFEEGGESWHYGLLEVNRYREDSGKVWQKLSITPARIRIDDYVDQTTSTHYSDNSTYYGKNGESLSVGLAPRTEGLNVVGHIARVYSDEWPKLNEAGKGIICLGDAMTNEGETSPYAYQLVVKN